MKQIAIFPNDTGISILIPALECGLSMEEICAKDVPSGVKYKIIDRSDLPQENDFRGAWEYDFTDSYDGVGA